MDQFKKHSSEGATKDVFRAHNSALEKEDNPLPEFISDNEPPWDDLTTSKDFFSSTPEREDNPIFPEGGGERLFRDPVDHDDPLTSPNNHPSLFPQGNPVTHAAPVAEHVSPEPLPVDKMLERYSSPGRTRPTGNPSVPDKNRASGKKKSSSETLKKYLRLSVIFVNLIIGIAIIIFLVKLLQSGYWPFRNDTETTVGVLEATAEPSAATSSEMTAEHSVATTVAESTTEQESSVETTEEKETTATNQSSIFDNVNVSKESLEAFLSYMVDTPYDNLSDLAAMNTYGRDRDSLAFWGIIRILLVNDLYEKTDGLYSFDSSNIKEYAKKYYNIDDFFYESTDINISFNEETNRYESYLQFGVFDEAGPLCSKPVVNQYRIDGDEIKVECSVKYDYSQTDGKIRYNYYVITLGYENDSYTIRSVSIQ